MDKRTFLKSTAALAGTCVLPAFGEVRPERIAQVTATQVGGSVVVEVETESGLRGHGFTAITNAPIVVAAVREVIAPNIIGQDALAREAISDRLFRLMANRGQTGHAVHAISTIDIALWDIAGKLLQQPVWRLLGGARAAIPTYTTMGQGNLSREQLDRSAREHFAAGQRRLKMVVAFDAERRQQNGESLDEILLEDAERIRIVREAAPEAEIMIDANHALDEFQTRRFIDRIAGYDLYFFEEPLRFNDTRLLADLRRHSPIPIAAGQNEGHINRFRQLITDSSVDVLQLNVCYCGGFTTALKVAGLAHAFGVPIDNGGGYALFNMHLHAGVANGGMAEWHLGAVDTEKRLYREKFELEGDMLVLPDRPGLGFELDRDALRDA